MFATLSSPHIHPARLLWGIAWMILSLPVYGQSERVAALGEELHATREDSTRARIMGELGWYWLSLSLDSAQKYAMDGLRLSQKIRQHKSGDLACNVLGQVAEAQNRLPEAMDYYQKSLLLRRMRGDQGAIGRMLINIGNIYGKQERHTEALESYQEALIALPETLVVQRSRVHTYIGGTLRHLGDWDQAHRHMAQSLDLAEAIHDTLQQARVTLSSANLFFEQDNHSRARAQYRRALALLASTGRRYEQSQCYHGLAVSYWRTLDTDSALIWVGRSLRATEEIGNEIEHAGSRLTRGLILEDIGRGKEALDDIRAAVAVYRAHDRPLSEARALNSLGMVLNHLGKPDEALPELERALALSLEGKDRTAILDILSNLESVTSALGLKEASARHAALHDSLSHVMREEFAEAANAREEILRSRSEAEVAKEKLAKEQAVRGRERVVLIAVVAGAILFAVIAILVIMRQKERNRALSAERDLQERNNERDRIIQESVTKATDAMIQGIETERERIGQELHDHLQGMIVTVKRQLEAMEGKIDHNQSDLLQQFRQALGLLGDSVKEIRRISQNLEQGHLREHGLKGALEDLVTSVSIEGSMQAQLFMSGFEGMARPALGMEYRIYLMIAELVNNVMKYSQAKNLEIQLILTEDGTLLITVLDDGVGFDRNAADFVPGRGLRSLDKRAQEIGGTFVVESAPGQGTVATIEVPYHSSSESPKH